MSPERIVIRKYENRRLYDTVNSRYVNLEEVARLVREGHEIHVVDARTGEDVTRLVLAQVILEEARTPESGLPLDFLREIIRASDRATREFLQWSLATALEQSRRMHEIWREQIAQGVAAPWTKSLPWTGVAAFPWPWKADVDAGPDERPRPDPSKPSGSREPPVPDGPTPQGQGEELPPAHAELQDLRRRVEALEARVARQKRKRR
jgi:polyhydroxyalkanoate synthesis repressor PhaR